MGKRRASSPTLHDVAENEKSCSGDNAKGIGGLNSSYLLGVILWDNTLFIAALCVVTGLILLDIGSFLYEVIENEDSWLPYSFLRRVSKRIRKFKNKSR